MKRNLLLLFIFPLIYFGCASKETVKKDNTRGTETVITPPAKKVLTAEMHERELIKNNKIKSVEKIRFVYDKSGKPVRESKISSTSFDKGGLSTKAIFYDKDKVKNSFSYKYDKEGRRTETVQLGDDNSPEYRFTYEYDKEGNKIKSTRINSKGKMENYYTYKYDSDNNLVEENWFDASGKKEYRIEYEYEDGRKSESYTYDENGKKLFKYVYKYDSNGNIVEEVQYDGDKALSVVQYVYKY